jgi:thiol-disulfide isomerase/thioredoxin
MKLLMRFLTVLLIAFIGLVLWVGITKDNTAANTSEFTTITGTKLSLPELRGKPVLVTFWATSCGSCMAEIPHLIELYNRFHPKGLALIAVAMSYDPPNQVVAMAKAKNLPYAISLDINGEHAKAFGGIWATPTTYLIGADGTISWDTVGMFVPDELANRIEQELKG